MLFLFAKANDMTQKEFTKLASEHSEDALTQEMIQSHVVECHILIVYIK